MKIEVGKKYVNRKCEIVEIAKKKYSGRYRFLSTNGDTYASDGTFLLGMPSSLDLISEYTEPVSKPSGQYQTITTQVTVVPTGEPIFSEHATNIIMDDEAGGPFIRVEQNHDEKGIIIELKEWPAIRDAIDAMVASAEKMGELK